MRVRRCGTLLIQPRQRFDFDFSALLAGGNGLREVLEWVALVPHQDGEVVVDEDELKALGALSPQYWTAWDELLRSHAGTTLDALLQKGLLIPESGTGAAAELRQRDEAIKDMHWRGIDAVVHRHSRWRGVDTVEAQRRFEEETDETFLERLGAPPPQVRERVAPAHRLSLVHAGATALDELLRTRVTCRNYDEATQLGAAEFGAVLQRAFGARAVSEYAPGVHLLKKGSPSAGGLHPVGAYVLVQRVEGVAPGLYHYHPSDHALEPLHGVEDATGLARRFLGGQQYFAQAHAIVVMAARFHRNFWKYRSHAKAYRAVILDAGHLSQTLYLAATELGLGAFVTAGVNEVDIEEAFGLDPMEEGVIAACGFGIRAARRNEVEFDPLAAVWPAT